MLRGPALIGLLVHAAAVLGAAAPASAQIGNDAAVLVFSKTEGYRHASITDGIEAVSRLGHENGFRVDKTEDAATFTLENLVRYAAVIFLNTSGDVLNEVQQSAFETYIRQGGGFAGIHGAAATEYDWEWYGRLVGAFFKDHPDPQTADVLVFDRVHPSTKHLPSRLTRFDEWYNFRTNPRGAVHVLAALDEQSYEGGSMGHDHPISWAHEFEGGRSWYTGLGHTEESYSNPQFLDHILGGIRWAAGLARGDAAATLSASFEMVVLEDELTDPMEIGIAPDGAVFIAERAGPIKRWNPATGETEMVGFLPVRMTIEDGLLGLTLDPEFEENGWIYVYYAPADGGPQRLARFTFDGSHIDMSSEKILLEIRTQQKECCHSAGSLAFGPGRTLYLATGDNTNPYPLGGSSIDERPGKREGDAQRTSANTNDLRGKILRIRPLPDGTYEIPEGNLFDGDSLHRPEIYAMGNRNPYRIAVDSETGWLYWGDVGIGNQPSEERGPWGWEEFNQAREPGFFGWPYFAGPNEAYRAFDYETQTPGEFFDAENPLNESPNNTGARELPPASPALIWYTYGPSEEFPELGAGGMSAMGGPVYRYDAETASPHALPPYYDGAWIIYEWMRNWMLEVRLDENGDFLDIHPFLPDYSFTRPTDVEVGPDGRLYVAEWGQDFWGSNRDARLVRLDYHGSRHAHSEAAEAGPATQDSIRARMVRDSGDTGAASPGRSAPAHRESASSQGHPASSQRENTPPVGESASTRGEAAGPGVSFAWPPEGGIYSYGEPLEYRVQSDARNRESYEIAVHTLIGHDTHEHALDTLHGLTGVLEPERAFEHVPPIYYMDEYFVLAAELRHRDEGTPQDAQGRTRVKLQPRIKQAEHFSTQLSAERNTYGKHPAEPDFPETAMTAMALQDGSYVSYEPVNLTGIEAIVFRIKVHQESRLELRLDAADGPLLAEVVLDPTVANGITDAGPSDDPGGAHGDGLTDEALTEISDEVKAAYEGWTSARVSVEDPGGTRVLFIVARGFESGRLFELDWMKFSGRGVSRELPLPDGS